MLCQSLMNLTEWCERHVTGRQLISHIKHVQLRLSIGLEIVVKICSLYNKTFFFQWYSISDLNLTDKPEKFNFTVSNSTVCQGSVVTFNCSADANPPVDTYHLLENGVYVRNGSNSLEMWSRNMSTGGVFNYKCIANNSVGTAYSMSVTVTVNGKQQIENYLL